MQSVTDDEHDAPDPFNIDRSHTSSRASSSLHDGHSEHIMFPRHVSPPPPDEQAEISRNERRYRMLLQHEFHPSRKSSFYMSARRHILTAV